MCEIYLAPLLEAAQQAVLRRVTATSDQLTARMQALSEVGASTVEGTAGTVGGTTKKTVKGTASTGCRDDQERRGRVQGALAD